jgi:hypothetical protein
MHEDHTSSSSCSSSSCSSPLQPVAWSHPDATGRRRLRQFSLAARGWVMLSAWCDAGAKVGSGSAEPAARRGARRASRSSSLVVAARRGSLELVAEAPPRRAWCEAGAKPGPGSAAPYCDAKVERQLVGFPWAADSCPWVGKLRTVLPFYEP